jgi:hypothetical protein
MKKVLGLSALLMSACIMCGCETETKVERSTTVDTPSGSTTTTETKKVETTGEEPPPAVDPPETP